MKSSEVVHEYGSKVVIGASQRTIDFDRISRNVRGKKEVYFGGRTFKAAKIRTEGWINLSRSYSRAKF